MLQGVLVALQGLSEVFQRRSRRVPETFQEFSMCFRCVTCGFTGGFKGVLGDFEDFLGVFQGPSRDFRGFQRCSGSLSVFHERSKVFNPLWPQGYITKVFEASGKIIRLQKVQGVLRHYRSVPRDL